MYDQYGNEITWVPDLSDPDSPKYLAIAAALERDIAAGSLPPGRRLPPQRVLADYLGLNLSTVTRAYRQCEEKGLIKGITGRGTFVSSYAGIPQDLLAAADGSPVIEMGTVLPLYEANERLTGHLRDLSREIDYDSVLRYVPPEGHIKHRYSAAKWLRRFRLDCPPEQIVITAGSQNALAVILTSLFAKGDRIIADEYTYTGLKSLAGCLGIILVPVRTGPAGIDVAALAAACRREKAKGIYLIPDCHNPTTAVIGTAARKEIARLIAAHDLLLLEDSTFGFTVPDGPPPVSSFIPDRSLFITGTAKSLSPAFRISYIAAPARFIPPLARGVNNLTWMASPLTAELVSHLLNSAVYDEIVAAKLAAIRERNQITDELLGDFAPVPNPTSFFRYLLLPPTLPDREIEHACRAQGIQVFSAKRFAISPHPSANAVRLAVSGPRDSAELRRGLQLLREVLTAPRPDPEPVI